MVIFVSNFQYTVFAVWPTFDLDHETIKNITFYCSFRKSIEQEMFMNYYTVQNIEWKCSQIDASETNSTSSLNLKSPVVYITEAEGHGDLAQHRIMHNFYCDAWSGLQSTQSDNNHFLMYSPCMMEKLAHAGEGGSACSPPFTISTILYKVVVYTPAERADTLPLFLLYHYMCSVVSTACCSAANS